MKMHEKSLKHRPKYKIWIWRTASFCIALAIFLFSSENGQESSSTSNIFLPLLTWCMDEQLASLIIRKAAHFTIYALLGFSVYKSFNKPRFLYALLVCVAYACFDEWHQSLVPDRSCQLLDVGIDSLGASVGCFLSKKWGKLS